MRKRNAIVGKCADCGRPILPDQPHSRFAVLDESGRPVPGRFLLVHIECPEPIRHASVASLADFELQCLGKTAGGHPGHPLYIEGSRQLVRL